MGPGQVTVQSWQDQEEDIRHISGSRGSLKIQDGTMIGVKVMLSPLTSDATHLWPLTYWDPETNVYV